MLTVSRLRSGITERFTAVEEVEVLTTGPFDVRVFLRGPCVTSSTVAEVEEWLQSRQPLGMLLTVEAW